ncbi:MAG: FtsH protease activity modulator HflK [Desulfobulbaceae bacterium]|nr:FtsH protease activity modulator HflK [Desulfobulbaceae bacterium]
MSMQDQQPPWGQKKKPSSPEEILAAIIQKIRDSFAGQDGGSGGNGSGQTRKPSGQGPFAGMSKVLLIIGAVIIFQVVYSSFYTIQPGEVGVVLQFGKYHRTTTPGLHFKIPYLEELIKVDIETVRKEEFGFRSRSTGQQQSIFERRGFEVESLMLTGDKNVINVAWIVQYRVDDPVNFLFKVQNVPQAVRDASEKITRRIVGNMDFDYVLANREILAGDAMRELQGELSRLESGVRLVTLQMQDINPPEPVKPAFNEVNEADQDMRRLVNEAEEAYNRVIPQARGNAKKIVEEAHGYAVQRVNQAQGETARFNAIVAEYLGAQQVTRRRMYLEAMQEILPNVDHVYVMDKNQKTLLPFLDLTRDKGSDNTNNTSGR